jgi:hypothetical protein
MRLDRLTNKFQLALADAQSLALGHDNQFIEPLSVRSFPAFTPAEVNKGRTDPPS